MKTARATRRMQVSFSLPVETPQGVQENTAASALVGESSVCRSQLAASAVAAPAVTACSHALPPPPVQETLARPDASQWKQAIDDDITSCLESDVWEATNLPEGEQALTSCFVLDRKRDGEYKARLVAGVHCQQQGIDFDETFAPVCSYRSVRVLLTMTARQGLVLRQFDVHTAFFNGELEKEVFIRASSTWQGHLVGCFVCALPSLGCAKRQGHGTSA
jgi:hypothetical protein